MRSFACGAFSLVLCGTALAQTAPNVAAMRQARAATRAASHAEWERQMK